ncbi:G5 domain-containing protein, partial [Nosocomiicoccus sp. HMSC059G07]|uniref:G5 domain-containing protein n=1 Tax=Nosocomiicoccus sp. HMSC059G07 TaxID=1739531 RepID=UPI001AEF8CEC
MIQEKIDEIIVVGQGVEILEHVQEIEEIPYDVEYINNDKLEIGRSYIDRQGINGQIIKTYEVSTFNGEELSRVLINVEKKDAVNKIIVVGTFDPTKVDDMTNGYTNTLMLIDSKTLKTIANISFIGKTFDNRLEDFINDFNNEN